MPEAARDRSALLPCLLALALPGRLPGRLLPVWREPAGESRCTNCRPTPTADSTISIVLLCCCACCCACCACCPEASGPGDRDASVPARGVASAAARGESNRLPLASPPEVLRPLGDSVRRSNAWETGEAGPPASSASAPGLSASSTPSSGLASSFAPEKQAQDQGCDLVKQFATE